MLPETLDNGLRSPNNNSSVGVPRNRASLCLSPVTGATVVVDTHSKRRSWCGTPSSAAVTPQMGCFKRYGELGHFKPRSDQFLEPYFHGFTDRTHTRSPGVPSPTPQECHRNPFDLPNPPSRSPSRESLISSNGGSDAGSEDSADTGYGAACDIGVVERLIRSHPIWFLPGIQRAGAFHLLQGKEEGCFVVRQSSQSDTMALSVRLPPDKGPYIEHYLIQSTGGRLGLETSENRFDNMPALIAHYANCCDELPVQLILPKSIRDAKSRQQLSSLALLGQEFWRYSPPPSTASSPDTDLVLNLNPMMSTFKAAEPSTPVSTLGSSHGQIKPARPNTLNLLNRTDPVENSQMIKMPSFRNEIKHPPPPPPRWSKPTTPQNNITVTTTFTFSMNGANGTSNGNGSPKEAPPQDHLMCDPKRMSPEGQTSTMSSKGSLRRPDHILSPSSSVLSPNSDLSILSPDTLSPLSITKTATRQSRRKHKTSKHYQESDILDSPTVYYRSAVGDKVSDYEDVWTNEGNTFKPKHLQPNHNQNQHLQQSPDLLQHVINNNNNNNVLSPTESSASMSVSNSMSHNSTCSTPLPNTTQSQTNLSLQSPDSTKGVQQLQADMQSPKQGSPFYAEPADSITQAQQTSVPRRLFRNPVPIQQRHSNPPALHSHAAALHAGMIERIEHSTEFNEFSSSVDNLSPTQRLLSSLKRPDVKPIMPPSVKPRTNDTWQLDNGWKFVGNDADVNMESSDADYDSDWPATIPNLPITQFSPGDSSRLALHDMIAKRQSMDMSTTDDEMCRMSAYDNVDDKRVPRAPPSEISELTEFSEPWNDISHAVSTETDDSFCETFNPFHPPPKVASIKRAKSFKDRLDPLLCAPRLHALRNRDGDKTTVGASIRSYALDLAQDKSTTFAQNIDNFIACTCDSKETNPQIVMRNMRQFMSGMKNYLVKHGEKNFNKEVERERNKLKSTEFLNLDAILESVLHRLVVRPLKAHLDKLFVDYFTKTGAIKLLSDNINYAGTRPPQELAIKQKITLPSETALKTIEEYLTRLCNADSPLEKLEFLLAAIAAIFNSVKTSQLGTGRTITLGADDFLPLFVWVLVKTKFLTAEIEAEYMWGLLHPSLLSGEGGYYLTTLSSAVQVLKNFKESNEENVNSQPKTDSVLKVVVPDELHGSILTKTLPARPHMTTKEVCKIIAHKARITNPQDYALYRLVDGEETMLGDNECPQDFTSNGKHVMLAYKRIDAKIAWPRQQSN